MVPRPEHFSGDRAPASGTYEQSNVFGSATGLRVVVRQGQPLPPGPEGHSWKLASSDADVPTGEEP
jgi:hypothetical protein